MICFVNDWVGFLLGQTRVFASGAVVEELAFSLACLRCGALITEVVPFALVVCALGRFESFSGST